MGDKEGRGFCQNGSLLRALQGAKMCALALVGSPCRVHGVVLERDEYSCIDVPL